MQHGTVLPEPIVQPTVNVSALKQTVKDISSTWHVGSKVSIYITGIQLYCTAPIFPAFTSNVVSAMTLSRLLNASSAHLFFLSNNKIKILSCIR